MRVYDHSLLLELESLLYTHIYSEYIAIQSRSHISFIPLTIISNSLPIMTIKEPPPNEEGKPKSTRSSVRGQDSGDDPGAVPVIPRQTKSTSWGEDKKQRYKLEHAEGTAPFAPPMRASRPTEQDMTDLDLEAKARARNTTTTTKEGMHSTLGATPVFPNQSTTNRPAQDPSVEPSSTVHGNNVVTENEIRIPEATTVEDAPLYAHAYVQNDVENNGDPPPNKTESPKRCTPAMRYSMIAAGVLCAIVLIVTLAVVFVGNRSSPVAPTPAPTTGKAQYVQYNAAWWMDVLSNTTLLSPDISDLELTCRSGGSLKLGIITSFLERGESPVCTTQNDSSVRCTQAPVPQSTNTKVLAVGISFQCHGTSPGELVGQAELFDTTFDFGVGESGDTSIVFHGIELQTFIAETAARDVDSECSDRKVSFNLGNMTYAYCVAQDMCTHDGVNQCILELEGRAEVQRDPINKDHIHEV